MPRRQPAGGGPGPGVSQQVPLDQRSGPVEMPASALERLKSMEGEDGQRRLFTSDLSTNEFLLIKEAGFDPVGVVVGSGIYHVGYQPVYASGLGLGFGALYADQELTVLSEAKYRARELAMARMEAEAEALGADGIVGVRLDAGEYEWGPDLVEFLAVTPGHRAPFRDKGCQHCYPAWRPDRVAHHHSRCRRDSPLSLVQEGVTLARPARSVTPSFTACYPKGVAHGIPV
jgi:uncharacterized protein YbjQ (UPF0145 family)